MPSMRFIELTDHHWQTHRAPGDICVRINWYCLSRFKVLFETKIGVLEALVEISEASVVALSDPHPAAASSGGQRWKLP